MPIKRVLVTGGRGFLGRRIVDEVRSAGYEVVAPGRPDFDLETGQGVGECFRRCEKEGVPVDAVVHSAAHYGGIGILSAEPLDVATRNLHMAATIFAEAARAGVGKIVSVGSTCAYPGDMPEADMREEQIFSGRCHESVEAYGFSKRVQLMLMAAAHKQHGISCSQVAPTNLYGEHDVFQEYRAHAIAALIRKIVRAGDGDEPVVAWGTGNPIRQFAYVGDVARIVAESLQWPHSDWPVNVGGEYVSIRTLTERIAEIVGLPDGRITWDQSKPDGVARKVVSEERLRTLMPSYRPTPFAEGLRRTVEWYMANRQTADARL